MKKCQLLLVALPLLMLLFGCPASTDDDGGGTTDAGTDRTVDRSTDPGTDPVVDPTFDPVVDPTVDQAVDQTVDPTVDPRPDTTADPTTDPSGGDFDECISGFLSSGVESAYGFYDEEENASFLLYFWDDSDTEPTMELAIELYSDYGAPSTPGTYPIDATEADYETCGICILALTETAAYMPVAGSGSITIDQIRMDAGIVGSTFSGSFDLTMQEVEIDSTTYATTPVTGGCVGDLEHSFSQTVQEIPSE